ncbi:MAG: 50S ribosomal protein L4 [Bacteroidetes bacterium CG23_combo_of_CG06-09_8_20_14_all_32_9]|nr:MAG: 50S ribosomal protein L4 [Bacteroidetes bacterium CG23_combo_of_CG06-09_8_20_14_all_32_9]
MELSVFNISGKDSGRKVTLNDAIFGIEPNNHAIYLDVKRFMANNRQGTHKSKQRSEISGSTRKIKRQKGTGGARAGSIKSPVRVGGGRAFGPQPRDYTIKLNKKVKQLAKKSALSDKAKNNLIFILEDFDFEQPKTKNMVELQNNFKINNKKSLIVLANQKKNIYLSSRNLKNPKIVGVSELTTYDIVRASTLLLAESSLAVLENNILKNKE